MLKYAALAKLVLMSAAALVSLEPAAANDSLVTMLLSKPSAVVGPDQGVFNGRGGTFAINNPGEVVFVGTVYDDPESSAEAGILWKYHNGGMTPLLPRGVPVVVDGQQAVFNDLHFDDTVTINDLGEVSFGGRHVLNDQGPYGGVWIVDEDGISNPIRTERGLPGFGEDWKADWVYAHRLSNISSMAFSAVMKNAIDNSYRYGFWFSELHGNTQFVAAQGEPLPGLRDGERLRVVNYDALAMNKDGTLIFLADFTDSGGVEHGGSAVWQRNADGQIDVVARSGDTVVFDGQPRSIRWFHFTPQLNNTGQVLIRATVSSPAQTELNDSLWLQDANGTSHLVALTGEANAPVEFRSFNPLRAQSHTYFNDQGKVAFSASYFDQELGGINGDSMLPGGTLADTDDVGPTIRPTKEGIWTFQDGRFDLIARVGGIGPGVDRPFLRIETLALNNRGQLLFRGVLEQPQHGPATDFGIWGQDRAGNLRLLYKTGQEIDVAPGPAEDLRTIATMGLPFNSALQGMPRAFNDRGQFILDVTFTDGSTGQFISNLIAVPEPHGAIGMLGGSIFLLYIHRSTIWRHRKK